MNGAHYPIGTPGKAWGAAEIEQWRSVQQRKRDYHLDVIQPIERLQGDWDVQSYGDLKYGAAHFPLFALTSKNWDAKLPCALITGGVHGYETSGVLGALRFAQDHAKAYAGRMNLLIAPCVSPWAYERIQRWNHDAVDPNRSFTRPSPAQEAALLMGWIQACADTLLVHIDLHETTDSDETEFSPAKAARDGKVFEPCPIPDGFYLVANEDKPELAFQSAIIDAVSHVTHIAKADAEGLLDGSPMAAHGVMSSCTDGVCANMTAARYTTTEVYPDSPRTSPEACIVAQTTAVCAALDFVLWHTRE